MAYIAAGGNLYVNDGTGSGNQNFKLIFFSISPVIKTMMMIKFLCLIKMASLS